MVPGTERNLLADLWLPPKGVEPSGLAYLYIHGGYYQIGEKGIAFPPLFTNLPSFRHLASQGHVVMDIGYRLVDETDIFGMTGDVKRAIAWMKENADRYGVDPDRIVLAGASSGGNLALLAAYSPGIGALTPTDFQGVDTSVRGVVSYYGVHDLTAFYALGGDQELFHKLIGGNLEDIPERYRLASPINLVDENAPDTYLFQGLHDQPHLVEAARNLAHILQEKGIPAVLVELPQTEHAFDMLLPHISPPAHSALYDLDRFLGLMVTKLLKN